MKADDLYRLIGQKTSGDMQVRVLVDGQGYDVQSIVVDPWAEDSTQIAWLMVEPVPHEEANTIDLEEEDTDELLSGLGLEQGPDGYEDGAG